MKTVTDRSVRPVTLFTGVLAIVACTLAAQSPDSREAWQRPDDIVAALGLTPGSRVADVGAGDGFFTVRLARAVGDSGRVLAVDVDSKMLETLKQLAQKEKLPNVDVVHGDPNDPHLEPDSLNAVLIVHAYHEMREHGAMLAHIRKALRPKGRLVIVEQITEARRDEPRDVQVKAHDLAPEYVVSELHAAGFRVERLDANFTTNPATKDINWIIVAIPGTRLVGPSSAPIAITPGIAPDRETSGAELKDQSLRIPIDELAALTSQGAVTVVDVRDENSFVAEHIPGAIWIPLSSVEGSVEQLRALAKPVVTYCS